jgi:hypothetical protein
MKGKLIPTLGLTAALLVTGCATKDPLARFYQPYQGISTNYPVGPGSYVTEKDGITIYHSLPPAPYTILGRFDRPNLPANKLARSAKFHQADAVFLSEYDVTGLRTDHGMLLWGNGIAAQTPTTTIPVSKTIAHAYLIKFIK